MRAVVGAAPGASPSDAALGSEGASPASEALPSLSAEEGFFSANALRRAAADVTAPVEPPLAAALDSASFAVGALAS